jgi:hypothetical protein
LLIRKKVLKEPLQWTMRESTRIYVALEGNSKIWENVHSKLLRVSQFSGYIHRLNEISRKWIRIRTKRAINKMMKKEFFDCLIRWHDASNNNSLHLETKSMLSLFYNKKCLDRASLIFGFNLTEMLNK